MTASPRARQLVAATVVALATLALAAAPASATVHPYAFDADRGLLTVGSNLGFPVPGTFGNCGVDIDLAGTVDDATPFTDNLGGTLTISAPTVPPFTTGTFILLATATSSGANEGNLDATTGSFTNVVFPTFGFVVRSLNTTTCVPGSIVCSGTATLTLAGSFTLPLATATAAVTSTAGTILSTSGCGFPFGIVFFPTAAITIARHSAFPADAGMLFN